MNRVEYLKEQKNKLKKIDKELHKYDILANAKDREINKLKKQKYKVEKEIKETNNIIKKLDNYNKTIKLEKKKRTLRTIAYSCIVTAFTMLLQIATKNTLAGVPLHSSLLCFAMVEGMIYINNTSEIKKLKRTTNTNKLKSKISEFKKHNKSLDEQINLVTNEYNEYHDDIVKLETQIKKINEELNNKEGKIVDFDEYKLTK